MQNSGFLPVFGVLELEAGERLKPGLHLANFFSLLISLKISIKELDREISALLDLHPNSGLSNSCLMQRDFEVTSPKVAVCSSFPQP